MEDGIRNYGVLAGPICKNQVGARRTARGLYSGTKPTRSVSPPGAVPPRSSRRLGWGLDPSVRLACGPGARARDGDGRGVRGHLTVGWEWTGSGCQREANA